MGFFSSSDLISLQVLVRRYLKGKAYIIVSMLSLLLRPANSTVRLCLVRTLMSGVSSNKLGFSAMPFFLLKKVG